MDQQQAEIDRLKTEVQKEKDDCDAMMKKLRASLDEKDELQKKITKLEAMPKLPLPESQTVIFQKKFDGLVMHGKTGLADAFELARAALKYEEDPKVKVALDRLWDRTKHEFNWLRDNGAELLGTVCRGGKVYSFTAPRRGASSGQR
jgi:hypothetical protein